MTISGGRTEQQDIFCHVTGFTTDLLSFIVVEHIRFFHGAIQFKSYCTVVTEQTYYYLTIHEICNKLYFYCYFLVTLSAHRLNLHFIIFKQYNHKINTKNKPW